MPASNASTTKVKALPDPRVERSREQVLRSTIDLLGEVGYGELSIEAVAARSGVAKSTIYRHWSGKLALVTDAFTELKLEEAPPAPGPVRGRLIELLTVIARRVVEPDWRVTCVPALLEASAHAADVAQVCAELAEAGTAQVSDVLDDAVASGELPASTDTGMLADALLGPIFLRGLFHRPFVPPDAVPHLVDQLLPSSNAPDAPAPAKAPKTT
jgi:AcrR family transcriptional regulator